MRYVCKVKVEGAAGYFDGEIKREYRARSAEQKSAAVESLLADDRERERSVDVSNQEELARLLKLWGIYRSRPRNLPQSTEDFYAKQQAILHTQIEALKQKVNGTERLLAELAVDSIGELTDEDTALVPELEAENDEVAA